MTSKQPSHIALLELCRVLSFYGDRLDLIQGKTSGDRTKIDSRSDYRAVQPWHHLVTPIYAELEELMAQIDDAHAVEYVFNQEITDKLPVLHRLRAAYEFDIGLENAQQVSSQTDPTQALTTELDAPARAIAGILDSVSEDQPHFALMEHGPYPLIAIALLLHTNCRLTCFEEDLAALESAKKLFARMGLDHRVTLVDGIVGLHMHNGPFDAVIGSQLLGVNQHHCDHEPKSKSFARVFSALKRGAPMIIPDPEGVTTLLYPPLDTGRMTGLEIERHQTTPIGESGNQISILVLKSR